jgi:hypothetical protein
MPTFNSCNDNPAWIISYMNPGTSQLFQNANRMSATPNTPNTVGDEL